MKLFYKIAMFSSMAVFFVSIIFIIVFLCIPFQKGFYSQDLNYIIFEKNTCTIKIDGKETYHECTYEKGNATLIAENVVFRSTGFFEIKDIDGNIYKNVKASAMFISALTVFSLSIITMILFSFFLQKSYQKDSKLNKD